MLGIVVTIAVVGFLLFLLGAIIRFSVVSARRSRGAAERLRQPDPDAVARVCGFQPPTDLVRFYENGDLVERVEFSLKNPDNDARWFIGGFYPLTGRDVAEQRKIHGVADGIPIAEDDGKGVYLVTMDGKVVLRGPGRNRRSFEVASSVTVFSRFHVLDAERGFVE